MPEAIFLDSFNFSRPPCLCKSFTSQRRKVSFSKFSLKVSEPHHKSWLWRTAALRKGAVPYLFSIWIKNQNINVLAQVAVGREKLCWKRWEIGSHRGSKPTCRSTSLHSSCSLAISWGNSGGVVHPSLSKFIGFYFWTTFVFSPWAWGYVCMAVGLSII